MATYNGQVTGGGLNLRQSASTSATILIQIPNNTQIVVSDYSANTDWYCTTYGGYSGFVMKAYVNILSSVATSQRSVTGGGLNLRLYPSTSAPTPIQIPNGTSLTVQEHNSTWCSTTYGGYSGFVMSQYLTGGGGGSGLLYAEVTASTLNVRRSPSTGGTLAGVIPNGRILICEDSGTSGWYKTLYAGTTAYVSSQYMNQITSPAVHNSYVGRMNYQYTPEVDQSNASYYDNASSAWCQLFVNWLLRNAHVPTSRVPTTAITGEGIQFWVYNTTFYFKSATWKGPLNTRYSLGVGSTLTQAEINYVPSPGDIIYFRWTGADSDVYVSHTGYVRSVSGSTVYTVEGNISDKVVARSFSTSDSQIVGYGKPNYTM